MSSVDTRKQFPMLNFCPTTSSLLRPQIAHYAYGMSKTTCQLDYCPSQSCRFSQKEKLVLTMLFNFTCQVRTFRGHTNEKNFVGLTVNSEYLACGSETNEVYVYHKVHKSETSALNFSIFHS